MDDEDQVMSVSDFWNTEAASQDLRDITLLVLLVFTSRW